MTRDLSDALHDLAARTEAGVGAAGGLDVPRTTSRTRSRRRARAAILSVASAAAAVVLAVGTAYAVGPHVRTQAPPGDQPSTRPPDEPQDATARPAVLPVPRPDAQAGTCGSDVAALRAADEGAPVGLAWATPESGGLLLAGGPSGGHASPEATLGRLVDRTVGAHVTTALTATDLVAGSAENKDSLRNLLAGYEETLASPDLPDDQHATYEAYVAPLREQVALLDRPAASTPTPGSLDLHLVVAYGGTVVATPDTVDPGLQSWAYGVDHVVGLRTVTADLVTCDEPSRTGGADLPAGDYEVYVSYVDPTTHEHTVTAPWAVTLLPPPPLVVGLPDDFPTDLPLPGGRLVAAAPSGAGGWSVEIAVEGDDAVEAAARLLGVPVGLPITTPEYSVDVSSFLDHAEGRSGRWHVEITASHTVSGDASVVCSFSPVP